jgi:predicted ATP-grasp superfamily ATP-dependent carboligase
MMRDALLNDLSSLPYDICTTVDSQLLSKVQCDTYQLIEPDADVWAIWETIVEQVDAVWFIAPETDDYLHRMTALANKHHKYIIGCGLGAIEICGSKLLSHQFFRQNGLNTIKTDLLSTWDKTAASKWIVKPDDGAGCDETLLFNDANDLSAWILSNEKMHSHIIQPYIEGCPASLSCLMHDGQAYLLSCNKQLILLDKTELTYQGFIVNGMRQYWTHFTKLANQVAALLPDLRGYVGIDVIVSEERHEQCKIHLLEVNPRLTTCYVALREAMGINPAALIMAILLKEQYSWPEIQMNEVLLEVKHE